MKVARIRFLVAIWLICGPWGGTFAADGQLELQFIDTATGAARPVRLEFVGPKVRTPPGRADEFAPLGRHSYADGKITLDLRRGDYRLAVEAGPEFKPQTAGFTIDRRSDDSHRVELTRVCDLAAEGWYAADLLAARPVDSLSYLLAAEGLQFAPVYGWQVSGSKSTPLAARSRPAAGKPSAFLLSTAGGSLGVILAQPRDEPAQRKADESTIEYLRRLRDEGAKVVALTTTGWEFPVWVAHQVLDAVVLIGPTPQGQFERAALRPHDSTLYPGKRGPDLWQEAVYLHLVDAGVRLPPVAGSGSAMGGDMPLGTARVYAHCESEPPRAEWWRAVAAGRVVVTNGPLIRPTVDGSPPGETFALEPGSPMEFDIRLSLATRSTIDYVEILQNGAVAAELNLGALQASKGQLPSVVCEHSGWFLVRCVTQATDRYERALSAPFYVQDSTGPRVGRNSTKFFDKWVAVLRDRPDASRDCTDAEITQAGEFWQQRLATATAE